MHSLRGDSAFVCFVSVNSSWNGTMLTVIKLTFFMSTFNPEVHRKLDSLLAEIGDNDYTKICEFEIILRYVQAYYPVSCSELHVDPVCCDVLQCWKSSAGRIRRRSCRKCCQNQICYKPIMQTVSICKASVQMWRKQVTMCYKRGRWC